MPVQRVASDNNENFNMAAIRIFSKITVETYLLVLNYTMTKTYVCVNDLLFVIFAICIAYIF